MRHTNRVAQILTVVFVLQFALLLGVQYALGTRPPSVSSLFFLGLDFRYFYDAAGAWLRHANPYASGDFTSPPAAMLLPVLLHRLPFDSAVRLFQFVNLALIVASVFILCRTLRLTLAESVDLALVAATFGAVHALLAGGNMDGLMLLLLVLAYAARRPALQAIAIGASFAIKIYTGVAAVALIRRRQWKILVIALAAAIFLTLPFLGIVSDTAARLFSRTGTFRTNGNISPALVFMLVFRSPILWKLLYGIFWLGTLAFTLKNDARRDSREWLITYIPWMLAAPALVLRYSAVMLLPVLARLIRIGRERRLVRGEWIMVAGCLLLGLYPAVFAAVLPLSPETTRHWFAILDPISSVGVTLLLLGTTIGSRTWLQPLPEELGGAGLPTRDAQPLGGAGL